MKANLQSALTAELRDRRALARHCRLLHLHAARRSHLDLALAARRLLRRL